MDDIAALMDVESKIGVMVAISLVSFFAVSFPTLSKQVSFLRIPPILFFVGKHFGTGVILATAFLHLLDDAFRSLRSPVVESKYGKIGKWTGLVILGSLLTIFLVEYASNTYVEHLRNKPSAPSTPVTSSLHSPKLSNSHHVPSKPPTSISDLPETTPLLLAQQVIVNPSALKPSITSSVSIPTSTRDSSALKPNKTLSTNGITTQPTSVPHSRSRPHSPPRLVPHLAHHSKPPILPVVDFIEVLTNSPRICRLGLAGDYQHHHHPHDHDHHAEDGRLSRRQSSVRLETDEDWNHEYHSDGVISPTIGRKRQIVSILVLQLGIMIHSLVIGLTLAVAKGSDFTSLTTAIMFHQLFEGLSLGIRIAALPPPKIRDRQTVVNENGHTDSVLAYGGTSSPNQSTRTIKDHSWLSTFKWHRCSVQSRWRSKWTSWMDIYWLKPTLSFLFAVTTPFGMTLGILLFGPGQRKDAASMLLIQGIMSAISAGMLIYAATVEMIAGDFVFGDVDGGHHHHHHEPDALEGSAPVADDEHDYDGGPVHWADEAGVVLKRGRRQRNGMLVDVETQEPDVAEIGVRGPRPHLDGEGKDSMVLKQSSLAKRLLAVVSLLLGVVMMIAVGMGE